MADNRDYWSSEQEKGLVKISEEVIASIAALAAAEVAGVSALASGVGVDIAELLGRKNLAKGVKINLGEDTVQVDVFIHVKYGFIICEVARHVQETIASSIESMTGLNVSSVNVTVTGVAFDKPEQPKKEKTTEKGKDKDKEKDRPKEDPEPKE